MNIIYISSLSGNKAAGLTYSVPAQVESQSKIDNVLWYNLNSNHIVNMKSSVNYYSINDFPSKKISDLPTPFNTPDLVIFQGVYFIDYYLISKELIKNNIPYIIIPRGSLTRGAQKIKSLKKKVANKLIFNRFIKNACAIQYLNVAEYQDSGDKWNKKHLIIPNGFSSRNVYKKYNSRTSLLKGVFIGRLHIYHKGIDLLIEACAKLKQELDGVLQIEIYGNDQNGSRRVINDLIIKHDLQNIVKVKREVFDKDKEAILLDSDFFILTSRFEGHPMGLIEALSYGLPCLVTKGTNMGEEIKEAKAGWTAEINTESIANALKALLKDRSLLPEKGKNAIELSKKYDWDNIAKISSEKYRMLINY